MFLLRRTACDYLGKATKSHRDVSLIFRCFGVSTLRKFIPAARSYRLQRAHSSFSHPIRCQIPQSATWPLLHTRMHTTQSSFSTATEPPSDYKLVYRGPLSTSIKLLKIFSMTSSITVLLGSPVLIFLGNPGIPMVSRIAISSIVCTFGVLTTFMLWWFTKSYVSRMWYSDKDQKIVVNTFSLFARTIRNEFFLKDAGPPANISSFATFKASDKHYFLHTEVFEDKQLLSNILGAYAQFEKLDQTHKLADSSSEGRTSS